LIQSTLTGVIVLLVVIQVYKALIEAFGISASSPLHDPLIWLFSLVVGVGGYIGYAAIGGPLTGAIVQAQAGQGFLAVVTCIGSYHLVSHPYFDAALPLPARLVAAYTTPQPTGVTGNVGTAVRLNPPQEPPTETVHFPDGTASVAGPSAG
jgi:hypothetical protein